MKNLFYWVLWLNSRPLDRFLWIQKQRFNKNGLISNLISFYSCRCTYHLQKGSELIQNYQLLYTIQIKRLLLVTLINHLYIVTFLCCWRPSQQPVTFGLCNLKWYVKDLVSFMINQSPTSNSNKWFLSKYVSNHMSHMIWLIRRHFVQSENLKNISSSEKELG